MNILHTGNKLPVQKGFFDNILGDLLPTLRFLDELYIFGNFVIIFSLIIFSLRAQLIIQTTLTHYRLPCNCYDAFSQIAEDN